MKFLRDIARIWWAEILNMTRDSGVLLFVLLVPLAYPLLYAFIYNNEVVNDVPVAVVDDSNSPLTRRMVRMIDAAPEVNVAAHCATMADAVELNRRGEVYGILHIPADFDRRLDRGEQGIIGAYADMAGMLYYKGMMLAATNVSLQLGKEIKLHRYYTGATERQETIAASPVSYEHVQLFNPQGGFAAFLIPPVLILILQQTLMLGVGMVGGGFRERHNGYALPGAEIYRNPFRVIVGKTLAYFLLYMLLAAYMFTVVTSLFSLPQLGHPATFFAFMVPFVLASTFMAIAYSAFIYRREDCILLYVFMSVPLLFISGVSWPGAAVPEFWKLVGCLFPSTFAINGFVRINSMGANLHQVAHEYYALWIQTGVYFALAFAFYVTAIRRRKRNLQPR